MYNSAPSTRHPCLPRIFDVTYECSCLLWIFFSVLFFKDGDVVKSEVAKEFLVYSEINKREVKTYGK